MHETIAFSPAGISSFFEIRDRRPDGRPFKDPVYAGARGGGLVISRGVQTRVRLRRAKRISIHVRINGRAANEARTTISTIRTHDKVLRDIATFLPASLELIITGMVLSIVVGVPLGVVSAQRRDKPADHATRLSSVIGVSIFTPWLGMMLQLVFFRWLGILPVGSRIGTIVALTHPVTAITRFYTIDSLITGNFVAFQNVLLHLVLPAVTLAAFPIGLITRMTRSTMVDILDEDYIRTAKAYGLSERIVAYKYALKNAIGPTITVLALTFAYSLVETFLVETVFNWPGLGRYAAFSIISLDYPAIMGIAIVVALVYVILNLVVDLTQAYLDPRIRLE